MTKKTPMSRKVFSSFLAAIVIGSIGLMAPANALANAYRSKSDFVMNELDLNPGDLIVDIGAGDGFWAEKMSQHVGKQGVVYAAEISQKMVDKLKLRYTKKPLVKPYLCPKNGTGFKENVCDFAFLSRTYHHLNKKGLVDYWHHLKKVVKPTGRVCVIESHSGLTKSSCSWAPGLLAQQASQAGWILYKQKMIPGTNQYIAIFAQKDYFLPEHQRKLAKLKAASTKSTTVTLVSIRPESILPTPRKPVAQKSACQIRAEQKAAALKAAAQKKTACQKSASVKAASVFLKTVSTKKPGCQKSACQIKAAQKAAALKASVQKKPECHQAAAQKKRT